MNISNCSLKDECQFVKELKNKILNMQESYETDAEAKFYDYVDKYNSKKLLTANDYVELNKNNEILMIYNQTLLKENKELKKQLEEITDYYCEASNIKWKRAKRIIELKTQQKVFIKYMNSCIKELEKESLNKLQNTINLGIIDITKTILQKYKEIIGTTNE